MQKLRFLSQLIFLVLLARMVLGLGGGDFEKWCPFGGVETLYLFFAYDHLHLLPRVVQSLYAGCRPGIGLAGPTELLRAGSAPSVP